MGWLHILRKTLPRKPQSSLISNKIEKISLRSTWAFLKPFALFHWRTGLIGASLIFLSNLIILPAPLVQRFLVDDVILGKRFDLLPWVVLVLGGIWIITKWLSLFQEFYMIRFQQGVMLELQKSLLNHTLRLPKSFFDKEEIGYLMSRISSDTGRLNWFFSSTLVNLLTNIIRFIGGIFFVFYLEWRLALGTIVFLPLMVFALHFFSQRIRTLNQQGMEQSGIISKHLQEMISAIPLIKAFSSEVREINRVMDAYHAGQKVTIENSVLSSFANIMINLIPDIAKGLVLVIGAYLTMTNSWTLGSLLAFSSYLSYIFGPARIIASMNLSLQSSLVALVRVRALFDIVPEENIDSGKSVERIIGKIRFIDVNFSYGDDENVLENLSFTIQSGDRVAIVGPSGVGKTTLISLLLCFYKPTHGKIIIDDIPLTDYNLPSLRKRIGYVSQSTLLLTGTFWENLCYGHPEATQDDVHKATRIAGIHNFIINLPKGYQSIIDERGVNLSEGQKQRLSIARALIKDPDILIFDEPTSAVDSILEHSILESLPKLVQNKTLFIIAHRLSTIQDSNKILLINEKKLVGIGTHQQLLEHNAYYRELVKNQRIYA
jgi:ABC-type multidrug transport system fused ATPase/permease subunit